MKYFISRKPFFRRSSSKKYNIARLIQISSIVLYYIFSRILSLFKLICFLYILLFKANRIIIFKEYKNHTT